jgi:peptidylglycine monooxygenase
MHRETLRVALGAARYRVQRPFGAFSSDAGLVSDVACDSRGHVFVLIRRDSYVDAGPAVLELTPEGALVRGWGADEIADGHMLTLDADGRVYVVDRDAHQVVVFNRDGTRIAALGARHGPDAPFNHPSGVAVAPNGDIYVADGYGACRIHRFAAGFAPLGSWGSPGRRAGEFSTPHALWVLQDGRVLVADRENDRVQVFAPHGAFLAAWLGFNRPMDIHADAAGLIYVTDQTPRVTVLNGAGMVLGRCRPVLNGAHGIWGDRAGRLYLAELSPSRLTRLVPEPD